VLTLELSEVLLAGAELLHELLADGAKPVAVTGYCGSDVGDSGLDKNTADEAVTATASLELIQGLNDAAEGVRAGT
jgi:hypothetical protein